MIVVIHANNSLFTTFLAWLVRLLYSMGIMSRETVSLYQKELAAEPGVAAREYIAFSNEFDGKPPLDLMVVVGVQRPGHELLAADGYEISGDEVVSTITLEALQSERLSRAYAAAMNQPRMPGYIECGSVARYVMGWQDAPTVQRGFIARQRYIFANTEPVLPVFPQSGQVYLFEQLQGVYPRRDDHTVLSIDDPHYNLSKAGTFAPFAVMSNLETIERYGGAQPYHILGQRDIA